MELNTPENQSVKNHNTTISNLGNIRAITANKQGMSGIFLVLIKMLRTDKRYFQKYNYSPRVFPEKLFEGSVIVRIDKVFRKFSLSTCSVLKFREFRSMINVLSASKRQREIKKLNFLNSAAEQAVNAKLSKHCNH